MSEDMITPEQAMESLKKRQTIDVIDPVVPGKVKRANLWDRFLCTWAGWRDHDWEMVVGHLCRSGPNYSVAVMVCKRCGARQEITSSANGEKRHPIH